MNQQLRPETLQVLNTKTTSPQPAPTGSATTSAASSPEPADTPECLQAGVFDERQATALRSAASALPAGSWELTNTPLPSRWMVYMGKFADAEALEKKRAELRARKVPYDRPNNPNLEPGLSLGRYSSEEAAQRELTNLNTLGVRTARVVQERAETKGYTLRLPAVTDALRPRLDSLRPAMAGKTLQSCS